MRHPPATDPSPLPVLPIVNGPEILRADPGARKFEIGELLFAEYTCPAREEPIGIWAQTDHFIHVLTASATWKTSSGFMSVEAGQTVFFKKGAYISTQHAAQDFCIHLFFIPDAFVKEVVIELAGDLPAVAEPFDPREIAIRVQHDVGLSAFFQAMAVYFAGVEDPPAPLLKLKLRELLTSILLGGSNPALSAYFRSTAAADAPSISAIMEMNFRYNLPLNAFAQMSHRSLSSFKREFQKLYGVSPGKWLLDRRLEHAASLLRTTTLSITDTMFECGFEDLSHFGRAFKEKFGRTPSACRAPCDLTSAPAQRVNV